MSVNPLQEILTGQQFQQCVNFYEADQRLDQNDRLTIATALQSIALKSNLVGYTCGMLGFFAPTAYFKLAKKPAPTPWFLIQYPFLSLCLGFGTLIVGNNVTTKHLFNKAKQDVTQYPPNANVYNIWQNMSYQNIGAYTLYYFRTSFNPMFIIRDPRLATKGPLIDEKLRQKQGNNTHFTDAVGLGNYDNQGNRHDLGVVDKLKLHHGFDVSKDT
ncbi:hypothetical protein KGF56_003068 [Candida oxycetoniae]|uniref:Transmembrane protein n=1 Tax=Candida oxycetoniae TaxID=497107 RepID=A0AAI9WXK4_9ASCO|nr:uncharacterized protein KGF56_003068 [Candida oxycetoniae]KAI3404168.1 hypothetical protein KGF56_003068 [Candida oxycetoniae]